MTRYPLGSRLPDLPLDPPEANRECDDCGAVWIMSAFQARVLQEDEDCPECGSEHIHRLVKADALLSDESK